MADMEWWPTMPIAKIFDRKWDSRIDYPSDRRIASWATVESVYFFCRIKCRYD